MGEINLSGFGYADLENEVKMGPESVVRIGSISKPMTMAMLGRLMEDNKIDLDLPVQTYVPNFPKKEVGGKEVITIKIECYRLENNF